MAVENCVKECCSLLASTHSRVVTDVEVLYQEPKKSVVKRITGPACLPMIKQALLFLTDTHLSCPQQASADEIPEISLSYLKKETILFLLSQHIGRRGWKGGMQNCFKHFDCFSKRPYKPLSLQRKMMY